MSKFSLIILLTVSECWEALFLSNLSMSFFMSSMLSSEKRLRFFTIALYCKYVWVIFVFINYFKSSICYVFCSKIKLTVSQNIQILIKNFIFSVLFLRKLLRSLNLFIISLEIISLFHYLFCHERQFSEEHADLVLVDLCHKT